MRYRLRTLLIVLAAIAGALALLLVEPGRPPDWRGRLVVIAACAALVWIGWRRRTGRAKSN